MSILRILVAILVVVGFVQCCRSRDDGEVITCICCDVTCRCGCVEVVSNVVFFKPMLGVDLGRG
jgi:hypothetical protein